VIRLLLVDDHEMVRTGLRTFLELQDDMSVVGEAGSGEEAWRGWRRCSPTSCCSTSCSPA